MNPEQPDFRRITFSYSNPNEKDWKEENLRLIEEEHQRFLREGPIHPPESLMKNRHPRRVIAKIDLLSVSLTDRGIEFTGSIPANHPNAEEIRSGMCSDPVQKDIKPSFEKERRAKEAADVILSGRVFFPTSDQADAWGDIITREAAEGMVDQWNKRNREKPLEP